MIFTNIIYQQETNFIHMTKKINCGIVGVGWWGTQMSDFIVKSKVFSIKTIYDSDFPRATDVSKKLKCKVAKSIDNLLSDNSIECVFVFSPKQQASVPGSKKNFLWEPSSQNNKHFIIYVTPSCQRVIIR